MLITRGNITAQRNKKKTCLQMPLAYAQSINQLDNQQKGALLHIFLNLKLL